jgi:hypothetical protein
MDRHLAQFKKFVNERFCFNRGIGQMPCRRETNGIRLGIVSLNQ